MNARLPKGLSPAMMKKPGTATSQPTDTDCPPRLNGSMPAGREQMLSTALETIKRSLEPLAGALTTQPERPIPADKSSQIRGDFTICTATWRNGAMICMPTIITAKAPRRIQKGRKKEKKGSCVVGPGSRAPRRAARHIERAIHPSTIRAWPVTQLDSGVSETHLTMYQARRK